MLVILYRLRGAFLAGMEGFELDMARNECLRLMLQALKGMAATFRVASSSIIRTAAERRLPSTDSVLMMLKWLERHLSQRKPGAEETVR
jgi:hypothetical protein